MYYKMRIMLAVIFCSLFLGTLLRGEVQTVPSVDLAKYMGTWYEIARLQPPWEPACGHNSLAIYTQKDDGTIEVVNKCQSGEKKTDIQTAKGKAEVVDKKTNAKWKVSFNYFNRYKWAYQGDYWIIQLADDYSYAVITDSTQSHLLILSRTPQMSEALYQQILDDTTLQLPNLNVLNVFRITQDQK